MQSSGHIALIAGAALSTAAALAHLVCIVWGAPAYRIMGAGSRMVRAAQARELEPTLVTLAVTAVLFVWAAYALSGAGLIRQLPLTHIALPAISAIYLARAIAFPLLKPAFPGNSKTFWVVSSSICLVIGLLHLYGVVKLWPAL